MTPSSILRRIPHKREFLARSLQSLGILHLLEQFTRLRTKSLLVLTFHRIARAGIDADPYYDPVISSSPEAFQAQIEFLASRYHVIPLPELLEMNQNRIYRSKRPCVLITFDDGYRDNFESALPVLTAHGVPATFFIPTAYIEVPRLPWWDHVAYIIKTTRVASFQAERKVDDPDPVRIDLGDNPSPLQRTSAIKTIINEFLAGAIHDETWFLTRLSAQAQVAVDSERQGRELFMGWDEIARLADTGMAIGSHGRDHLALAHLSETAQAEQLADSKHLLEARLHRDVCAIAYPFGWPGTFTSRTLTLAREAGYSWGFSSLEGINRPRELETEPLALRRLSIGSSDSPLLLRARAGMYAVAGRSLL